MGSYLSTSNSNPVTANQESASVIDVRGNTENHSTVNDEMLMLDTVVSGQQVSPDVKCVTMEKVQVFCEQMLEIDEEVSLIYLLYDDPEEALRVLKALLKQNNHECQILNWIRLQEIRNTSWKIKLLEALAIVQDFRALKYFGCSKTCAERYFSSSHTFFSKDVSLLRKGMFTLFDNFTRDEATRFLKEMKMFPISMDYLEVPFLVLEFKKDITWENNFEFLRKCLKNIGMFEATSIIDDLLISRQNNKKKHCYTPLISDTTNQQDLSSILRLSPTFVASNTSQRIVESSDSNCYEINEDFPGKCIIFNVEHFHWSPGCTESLERRVGTEFDRDKLIETFQFCGYSKDDINCFEDPESQEIIDRLIYFCESIQHDSSIFVCILSHGTEGCIFGSDSKKVPIDKIIEIMENSNEKLIGKPKVLIVQACRGNKLEEVPIPSGDKISKTAPIEDKSKSSPQQTVLLLEEYMKKLGDEEIVFDGPKAKSADLFLYFPTVPRYISVRVEKKGTWFIQTLCEVICDLADKEDLVSIFLRTNRIIQEKIGKCNGRLVRMVPHMTLTCDRCFFLPIGYKTKFRSV